LEGGGHPALVCSSSPVYHATRNAKHSLVRRTRQRVEKVGFELVATTNRVLNGPKAACLVSFGARPGVRMATKGVFQQADAF
jgi:hypothetical protein